MKKIFLSIVFSFCLFVLTQPVLAYRTIEQNNTFLDEVRTPTGISDAPIQDRIGSLIKGALTITGTLFFALMFYGGFLWMTAHGEEEPINKAKNTIFAAIIGLSIVISAYAITNIVTKLTQTGPTGAGMSADGTPGLSPSAQSAENMKISCDNANNQCIQDCPPDQNSVECIVRCDEKHTECNTQVEAAIVEEQAQQQTSQKVQECENIQVECTMACMKQFPDTLAEQNNCIRQCGIFYTSCIQ